MNKSPWQKNNKQVDQPVFLKPKEFKGGQCYESMDQYSYPAVNA